VPPPSVQSINDLYYEDLYRFAWSLAGQDADACDLAQQTMLIYASKGASIQDPSKVKSWLFTTLHREFLKQHRRSQRFSTAPLEETVDFFAAEAAPPQGAGTVDARTVLGALQELEEGLRAPISLFYLKDMKYREIAEILQLPIGTVMSRLARAKAAIRERLGLATETFQPALP
jgi:RNA polymerase sigma-70 factor, ECF subfamily